LHVGLELTLIITNYFHFFLRHFLSHLLWNNSVLDSRVVFGQDARPSS
jgi:hypothetical protein